MQWNNVGFLPGTATYIFGTILYSQLTATSICLLYPFADAPHLPKVTISHLQLITYGHHSSNKQALRLLQRLAPQWRKIGEILGLHGVVIETIENPGSGLVN